jgi:CRP-like cAMP-binding protein
MASPPQDDDALAVGEESRALLAEQRAVLAARIEALAELIAHSEHLIARACDLIGKHFPENRPDAGDAFVLRDETALFAAADRTRAAADGEPRARGWADLDRPLVRGLRDVLGLGVDEVEALLGLPWETRRVPPGTDLVREGDRLEAILLIEDGWAARYKLLPRAGRQIVGFMLPADLLVMHAVGDVRSGHGVRALDAARVLAVPRDVLADLIRHRPRIGTCLARARTREEAILHEWLARLGRRSAYERVGHLLLELLHRLDALGLTDGVEFTAPLSQQLLGDAVGLTNVHVSRVLRRLHEDGLVSMAGHRVTFHNRDGLATSVRFEPTYLGELHARR